MVVSTYPPQDLEIILVIADLEHLAGVVVGPREDEQGMWHISLVRDGQPQFDVVLALLQVLVVDVDASSEAYLVDLLFSIRIQGLKAQYRVLLPETIDVHVQFSGEYCPSYEFNTRSRERYFQAKDAEEVVDCVETGDGLDA